MIGSRADLERIGSAYRAKMAGYEHVVMVCYGAGCVSSACREVYEALVAEIERYGLQDKMAVQQTGCMGTCSIGPVLCVLPEKVFYTQMDPEKVREVVCRHLNGGAPVEEYTFYDGVQQKHLISMEDIPFFREQLRIVLRNCGLMDVHDMDAYIARDGYLALAKALEMPPQQVVDTVKKSGLKGRGGANFSVGTKWESVSRQAEKERYMICNGNEGDPGVFMDRSILAGDPHSIIEAVLIGAYAIGAEQGIILVRRDADLAFQRVSAALASARREGLVGRNILGSGFSCEVTVQRGAGVYVGGEETALIACIEGKRAEPAQKPPYPFRQGLYGKPTAINNVETLANVAPILLHGAEWYRSHGNENSVGCKVYSVTGRVQVAGMAEVEMGTPLRKLIYDICGGVSGSGELKAIQVGGPAGGFLREVDLDVPLDYPSVSALGADIGSGGLIVNDESCCMVENARFFAEFARDESCGQCTACRLGNKKVLKILERICRGEGEEEDLEELQHLCHIIRDTAKCGLGQAAPNPILSGIQMFREEYEQHILAKQCSAGVCKMGGGKEHE